MYIITIDKYILNTEAVCRRYCRVGANSSMCFLLR